MSEVDTQTVEWLWEPYIHFGKVTIVQGNPGDGKPVAFCLDPETGFSWIGEYDITADELLSGACGNTATKTEQAKKLILDLLADGKELASEDIDKAAAEAGISVRTVQAAKKTLDGRITLKLIGAAWYHALKK